MHYDGLTGLTMKANGAYKASVKSVHSTEMFKIRPHKRTTVQPILTHCNVTET
jgi:hypothetical protein